MPVGTNQYQDQLLEAVDTEIGVYLLVPSINKKKTNWSVGPTDSTYKFGNINCINQF